MPIRYPEESRECQVCKEHFSKEKIKEKITMKEYWCNIHEQKMEVIRSNQFRNFLECIQCRAIKKARERPVGVPDSWFDDECERCKKIDEARSIEAKVPEELVFDDEYDPFDKVSDISTKPKHIWDGKIR